MLSKLAARFSSIIPLRKNYTLLDCSKDSACHRNIKMRVRTEIQLNPMHEHTSLAKRISTAYDIRANDFPAMQRRWQPFINRDVRYTLQSAGVERKREMELTREMFRPRYRRVFLTILNLYKSRKGRVFCRKIKPTYPPFLSLSIRTLICCINVAAYSLKILSLVHGKIGFAGVFKNNNVTKIFNILAINLSIILMV